MVFNNLRRLWSRWHDSKDSALVMDTLLVVPEDTADLAQRNRWLIEVAYWLRRPERDFIDDGQHPEHGRLKAFLKTLEQRPDVKIKIMRLLRSILRDNDSLSLLCDTGVATKPSFWGEMFDRLRHRFVPTPPSQPELAAVVALGFVGEHDADWIHDLDQDVLRALFDLVRDDQEPTVQHRLLDDLAQAVRILISYVEAAGLSYSVRSRLREASGQHSPFYQLSKLADLILVDEPKSYDLAYGRLLEQFHEIVDACYLACDDVYAHLDEFGVSVDTVFQVETMRLRLARIELLLRAWVKRDDPTNYARLMADLVLTVQGRRSVGRLAEQSFALLSRKVVERSAEAGEHYITETPAEYWRMFRRALGGGGVVAGTVYLKFLIINLGIAKFFENILQAFNYAGSFLLIQFASFTLATKQPAMTAPALAQLLDDVKTAVGRERFLDRAMAIIRTQFASILGNLAMVVPVAILVQIVIWLLFGFPSMTQTRALSVIDSVSPFSFAMVYAAFTGVLLWLSSLIAGLADNWFVLHHVEDVIRYNRRLNIVFGAERAARWGAWWREHVAVVAANVSLGLLLVYGPAFVGFLGVGMDVRHVTLSAGSFAAAAAALGWAVFLKFGFWLGILGIFLVGLINVVVSFALAFNMALRSRDLPKVDRHELYLALRDRVRAQFKTLLLPKKIQ